ncbi:caspase family protein [Cognatiyoonia sp. IB215446]|uniref:caspase family protein n=1 Tax=Cognatiyoonia sp. IB215446 TaxID=3097355 RepID=UPI002A12CCAC|nr:caspase family protein [Cognatiyoonia sp. IB215446]MDX8346618.1 caspase family protein [Cognatiyoonia sp. IB215446]
MNSALKKCLAVLMVLICAGAALAEERVALVIGNGDYSVAAALPNPVNDATDMTLALENLGFDVMTGLDLNHDDMAALIAAFGEQAKSADVALVFYAGHGFQVSGANYLLPVDGTIASTADVPSQTISMQTVLDALEGAPGLKIIMLDACRDNPFGGNLSDLPDGDDGLARLGSDADLMIVFATQPDNVAYDGVGRNSFFTEAVLSHIFTPGQNISDMMINVRRDVLAATGGRQIPWDSSSLTRQFLFDQSPQTVSEETLLWQVAASGRDPQLLNIYLQRYPEGKHTGSVQAILLSPVTRQSVITSPERAAAQAADLWALARRTRMRQLVEVYLAQYPDGPHAEEAQLLLDSLPRAEDVSPGRICERLATHPGDATANTAGVSLAALAHDASLAINTCRDAIAQSPRLPHYRTLLARAYLARGDYALALEQYEAAAAMGDLRALFSLGVLYETGTGVDRDFERAVSFYKQSADGGLPDAQVNLALEFYAGQNIAQDRQMAVELMQQAAAQGHRLALFNLGAFSLENLGDTPAAALGFFERAGVAGHARGYYLAATILDDGEIMPKAATRASQLLLMGIAEGDSGLVTAFFDEGEAGDWSAETLRSVQTILTAANQYGGPIDGLFNPEMELALVGWRTGGFRADLLFQ